MQKSILFILAMSSTLLLGGLNAHAVELKGWVVQSDSYPQHKGLVYFFDRLKANTGGKFTGKVYCCKEMGSQKAVMEKLQDGDVDIALVSTSAVHDEVTDMKMLNLPFLFRDPKHMMAALNGAVGKEFQAMMKEHGYFSLGWLDGGSRSFYSRKKPLVYVSDFKGMKIRLANRKELFDMAKALGAEPVKMEFDDVPEALKRGELDAAENDLTSYLGSGHYKDAPIYTLSHHIALPIVVLISKKRWMSLTPADKKEFEKSMSEAGVYTAAIRASFDAEKRETLEKAGVKFVRFRASGSTISLMKEVYRPIVTNPRATELMFKIQSTRVKD